MLRRRLVGLLFGALIVATPAHAQERSQPTHEITFEQALELVRGQSPDLATARARVNEARSGVDAASVWRFNPQLGVSAGPRFGATSTDVDWAIEVAQWLEVGGQRDDRLAAARAGVDGEEARRNDSERLLLREVGLAFAHALYWGRRVELELENRRIAEEIARIARRRHEVGDSGGLENSVALLALARSRIGESRAQAALVEAEGRLKILLGFEAKVKIMPKGDLQRLGAPTTRSSGDNGQRPDLQALTAEIRAAKAEAELGRDARIPNIGLGATYSREEGTHIVQGSVALMLPLFNHGQGATTLAEARSNRIETELKGAKRRAAIEVETASQRSQLLSVAARQFEENGPAILKRSERVATTSYEAGAIPLGELLALRRELVQTKLDYADLLLGAAAARLELTASMGDWQ